MKGFVSVAFTAGRPCYTNTLIEESSERRGRHSGEKLKGPEGRQCLVERAGLSQSFDVQLLPFFKRKMNAFVETLQMRVAWEAERARHSGKNSCYREDSEWEWLAPGWGRRKWKPKTNRSIFKFRPAVITKVRVALGKRKKNTTLCWVKCFSCYGDYQPQQPNAARLTQGTESEWAKNRKMNSNNLVLENLL